MLGQQGLLVDDLGVFERNARVVWVVLRDRAETLEGGIADFDVLGAEGLVGFGGTVDGRDEGEALFFFFCVCVYACVLLIFVSKRRGERGGGGEREVREVRVDGVFRKKKRKNECLVFLSSSFSSRSLHSVRHTSSLLAAASSTVLVCAQAGQRGR